MVTGCGAIHKPSCVHTIVTSNITLEAQMWHHW